MKRYNNVPFYYTRKRAGQKGEDNKFQRLMDEAKNPFADVNEEDYIISDLIDQQTRKQDRIREKKKKKESNNLVVSPICKRKRKTVSKEESDAIE